MNVRTMMVGFLAVVSGISAMVLVQALRKPAGGPVIERSPVVFVVAEVRPGESIDEAMVEVREIPKEEVPEDAIRKPADAIGRAALSQLDKGDMLREKKLAEKGAGRGMAALIKPGMRAFTIQTPSFSSSLAGFLLPGNRVDVLLTTNSSGGTDDATGGATTTTLLQNVEILAVHTTVNTPTANKIDPDQARSVTLLVRPEDASLLDLGQNKGTLHLSLRNLKDAGAIKPKPATLADLNLVPPKPPAAEPPPSTPSVVRDLVMAPTEQTLAIRTLRGTVAGSDTVTVASRPGPLIRTAAPARLTAARRGSGPPP